MKPLFFNPRDQRNPCNEKSLGPSWRTPEPMLSRLILMEMRDDYVRRAPYGAGLVGGSAVVSEVLTVRLVKERAGVPETTQEVKQEPGRRDVITTERLEIVTTVTTFTSVVTSAPVATGGGRSPERAQPKASE